MKTFLQSEKSAKEYLKENSKYTAGEKIIEPQEYITKIPTKVKGKKQLYNYLLSIEKSSRNGYYKVTMAKYLANVKSGHYINKGYYIQTSLLTDRELKQIYDLDITKYNIEESNSIKEMIATTPLKQIKIYNSLGFNNKDFSFYTLSKKNYPVISLSEYKEELSGLNSFDDYEGLSTTFGVYTLNNDAQPNDKYFIGYFGDTSGIFYEYGVISNSIADIYEKMKDYDVQSGVIIIINKQKKRYIHMEVYPFTDEYGDFDEYFKSF